MENGEQGDRQMAEQDFRAMSLQLRKNKEEVFHILHQNPKVGVYLNETHDDWDRFYLFFINFLRSEIGPRGECAKLIRGQLLQRAGEVDAALLPFKQSSQTHIREIYMKHKFFVPCEEYPQLLKTEQAYAKFSENLSRLSDPNSPMRRHIVEGLTAKHGQQYDLEGEFSRLQANYVSKMEEAEKQMVRLRAVVVANDRYHEFMRVKQLMEPYFRQWTDADSNMGRESVRTGQAFEEKVSAEMLPYLLAREKRFPNWPYSQKKFEVFTNVSWIPKSLGEIDIAFGYRDEVEDRYFIFTLIECKSRLFDLREAYKQVSLDDQEALNKGPTLQELKEMKRLKQLARKEKTKSEKKQKEQKKEKGEKTQGEVQKTQGGVQKAQESAEKGLERVESAQQAKEEGAKKVMGKKFLSTKYGAAQLVEDHHFYIVTTLPQNDFVLPIESKMKEGIEKYSKNRFIEDMESEPLYLLLRQAFAERMSPLDWLIDYEKKFGEQDSNILVLR